MKILAFSDLHQNVDAAHAIVRASIEADVVVGAGDFGTRGDGATETLSILKTCTVPVVFVHGNHDNPEELHAFVADWPSGHYLHGDTVTLAGVAFFGLGGEVPARNDESWNATETEAAATAMLAQCPTGAILVTHTPPLGYADIQKDGTHEGSTAIRDTIRLKRPALNLCGHIHHAWGLTGMIGPTRITNLGPKANWFEI